MYICFFSHTYIHNPPTVYLGHGCCILRYYVGNNGGLCILRRHFGSKNSKKLCFIEKKKLKQLSRNQYPLMLAQRYDVNENALVIQLPTNVLAHFT